MRARFLAARRLRARRSSSDNPPQTPASWPLSSAQARQASFTSHRLQTFLAELFFPIGNTGPALAQIEEAKKVCNRCDVKEACLAWALESGQDAGVWGGLSEDERRALKRRAARNRARMMESQNQF